MVLRESLSNQNGAFVKLASLPTDTRVIGASQAFSQASSVTLRDYRMTRQLTPDELDQVFALYRLGKSTYQLARQFGTNRHTITSHLRRGGVSLRSREKLTPELIEQAARLYAAGQSLAVVGKQLGLSPMTVGKAVTSTGMKLRDRHGRSN